jgi:hypothetical protein
MNRQEINAEINKIEPLYETAYNNCNYTQVAVYADQLSALVDMLVSVDIGNSSLDTDIETCPNCGTTTDSHWESCASYDHDAYYRHFPESSGIYPE